MVEAGFDQSADWEGFDKFEDLRSMDFEVAVCLSTWFFSISSVLAIGDLPMDRQPMVDSGTNN